MSELILTLQDSSFVHASRDDGAEVSAEFVLRGVDRRMVMLFADWLSDGGGTDGRKITRRSELEVLGMLLYEALLPAVIGAFFERSLSETAAAKETLRLQLSFRGEAAQLAALPWEFLYRPDSE